MKSFSLFNRIVAAVMIAAVVILPIRPVHAAVITAAQVTTVYVSGTGGDVIELLIIKGVTSADTVDVSTIGTVAFKKVRWVVFGPAGFSAASNSTAVIATSGTGTNTTLTLASLANDSVWVLVAGGA